VAGEVDDVPGRTVAADQPDAIAGADAEIGEGGGTSSRSLRECSGADALEARCAPHHEKIGAPTTLELVEEIRKGVHGDDTLQHRLHRVASHPRLGRPTEDNVIDNSHPVYVPILMPNDLAALRETPSRRALMLSAVCHRNERLADLVATARARAETLLVDPKTPHFQFEGYMSMPDYRALPYSPGQGALGTLWEPSRFARREARAELIDAVFAVQRELGADLLLAPYFYVPHHEHRWLEVGRACAREATAASAREPIGVPLCIDIDALIDPEHLRHIVAAYSDIPAALFWVTIINYDERRADPRDALTVMQLLHELQADGTPVVLSHTGRSGLVAIARGAAGYAAGSHGLEDHPRSYFREMMGSRPANSYYLHECFVHLGVRQAQACLELEGAVAHETCDCPACGNDTAVARMVSRRLSQHAMWRRFLEIEDLRGAAPEARCEHLIEGFSTALERVPELSAALVATGRPPIREGDYHYLEVLREAAGGPAATIPVIDD
jgi:hypothetical protein